MRRKGARRKLGFPRFHGHFPIADLSGRLEGADFSKTGTVAGRGRQARWTPESDRRRFPMPALRRKASVGIMVGRSWPNVGHGQNRTNARCGLIS